MINSISLVGYASLKAMFLEFKSPPQGDDQAGQECCCYNLPNQRYQNATWVAVSDCRWLGSRADEFQQFYLIVRLSPPRPLDTFLQSVMARRYSTPRGGDSCPNVLMLSRQIKGARRRGQRFLLTPNQKSKPSRQRFPNSQPEYCQRPCPFIGNRGLPMNILVN